MKTFKEYMENTTVSSVALPPTMMKPKKILRRRKDPKVEQIVVVDRRFKKAAKAGTTVLKAKYRR